MPLGLPKQVIEAEVSRDLIYSGLDQRAAVKISEAIAEAIYRNNRRIQEQLAQSGIDRLQTVLDQEQPTRVHAGVI